MLQLMFTSTVGTGKECDPSDFDRCVIVGARRAGLGVWYITADQGIFMHNSLRMVQKTKASGERRLCTRKWLVDVRGQRRMVRTVRDGTATVTQINTLYNCGEPKSI